MKADTFLPNVLSITEFLAIEIPPEPVVWSIEDGHFIAMENGWEVYYFPCEDVFDARELADWWRQIAQKTWATRGQLAQLADLICHFMDDRRAP